MDRKIDLVKAMRTFIVVADTMSFSETSRRLNIVVSAVSRQVKELEKHFDCILLYRTTRAMKLSPEGEFYLEKFRQVIAQLDTLELSVSERQQTIKGHLRITSPYNFDQLGIQDDIAAFLRQHPEVTLSWVLANRYVNLVEEGFDLAIRVGELADSSFIAKKYGTLEVDFVASPDYLATRGEPSHPNELVNHRCLIDSSNRQPGRYRYREGGKECQVSVKRHIELNQARLLASFAASGLGVAQLPRFLVADYLQQGKLITILHDYSLPTIDVSLVYPASRLTNPTLRALIDYLLEAKTEKI